MNQKFISDEWKIIEPGFDPDTNRFSESIFSLGNEHMGLRGFFEEGYSGDSLQGTYIAGIFYPDKTRVGWWKNGYPEFFAKVVNSTNWIAIDLELDGTKLDLARCRVSDFRRELDMKEGRLTRSFICHSEDGKDTAIVFTRFLSMADNNLACISATIKPLNYSGKIMLAPGLDGNVTNEDSNYGEKFWEEVDKAVAQDSAILLMKTKKSGYIQATAFGVRTFLDGREIFPEKALQQNEEKVGYRMAITVEAGQKLELQKFVAVCTSRDYDVHELRNVTLDKLRLACEKGWASLYREHTEEMARKWEESDVVIEGDPLAQQGIRYNIFQLNQTYAGKDPRLNIGPKGFTGEKYGGSTYWDTEAFCFPFYL